MKKILRKIKKQPNEEESSLRITNETVAEHRERVLAGGRRFKYPMQYARHKLVFNALGITLVFIILLSIVGWWQLYKVQDSSTFFYRVTKILPLPVASVDGALVRYSDYLMRYRSQEHWLSQKNQIEQGKEGNQRQLDFIKRAVMDSVEADAYAAKLAKDRGITVSDEEVDRVVRSSLQTANGTISQELYDASTLETLGYDREEYRLLIYQSLIHQKVAYALDDQASETVELVKKRLAGAPANQDFAALAKEIGRDVQSGSSGIVRKTNQDAGLTLAALKLQKGQVSTEPIKSTTGDGYYFLRLDELKETELSYSFIKIPLSAFDTMLSQVRKDNKVKEYIDISKTDA